MSKRESIKLSTLQWIALARIAAVTGSVTTTTSITRPSWRALLRRIADGELIVRTSGRPVSDTELDT